MNASSSEPVRWTARRWLYAIACVFVLQSTLLFVLGRYDPPVPARANFRTAVHLIADPWSAEQLARLPGMHDPTLFALPAEGGFSGAAWLHQIPFKYSPARWTEPPRWLELNPSTLGGDLARSVAANVIQPALTSDKPVPALLRYEPGPGSGLPPVSGTLRLEGPLAARGLLAPIELPAWPHTELLSNTTVQAIIDADGYAVTTRLLGESGYGEADLRALQLAASARFRPIPHAARDRVGNGPLAWGRLIFHWRTVPPVETNPPSIRP